MVVRRLITLFGWGVALFIIAQVVFYASTILLGVSGILLAILLIIILAGVAGYIAEKSALKNNLYPKRNSGLIVGFVIAVIYGFAAAVVDYFITSHFNFNSGGLGILVACVIGGIIAEHTSG